MCGNQSCSASHLFFDRIHDGSFRCWIECRSRFVEQQNWCIFQKCSRDSDALSLANTQMPAAFADEAVVSLWHLLNKLIGLRSTSRFNDLFLSRIGSAIGNVLANCCGEK